MGYTYMAVEYHVISIGTLSRNRFWNETSAKRPAHSTTVLIREKTTTILVDPGLPGELLAQRLDERAGLKPEQIDVVFLTTFRPVHRRGLRLFSASSWLMYEPEVESMRGCLAQAEQNVDGGSDDETARLVREEQWLLDRIKPADEKLTPAVHLFPLVGVSPGAAGLLLATPSRTVIVAGDAVVTQDYFASGRVYEQVFDVEAAQSSFSEIVEIADEVIPGHDNGFRVIGR